MTHTEQLHAALTKAVELIKQWHNMQAEVNFVKKPVIEHTWQLYWNNAPELKPIREALEASRPADWKQKLADYLGYKSFDDLDTAESSVANWIEKNVL